MDQPFRKQDSVYSNKLRAGKKRTYFFDVKQTKGNDYYLTLTESTRKFNSDSQERHKILVYKEDFNRFLAALQDTIDHIKTNLMPDYDVDEFARHQEELEKEYEKRRASESTEDDMNW